MENVIFLFPTSLLGVIHKGTGNVGPTLALKLEGSGCRMLEGHLGLMKPLTCFPGVMNSLQAQMEGFTQMIVFIYFIILSQERRKLLLYLCVPEYPLSNLTKPSLGPLVPTALIILVLPMSPWLHSGSVHDSSSPTSWSYSSSMDSAVGLESLQLKWPTFVPENKDHCKFFPFSVPLCTIFLCVCVFSF